MTITLGDAPNAIPLPLHDHPLDYLQAVNWPLREIADHRTYEAISIEAPDGNDLELCLDRPMEQWPHDEEGRIAFVRGTIDLDNLLAELTRS